MGNSPCRRWGPTLSSGEGPLDEVVQRGRPRVERELAQHPLAGGRARLGPARQCLANGGRDGVRIGGRIHPDPRLPPPPRQRPPPRHPPHRARPPAPAPPPPPSPPA